MNKNRKIKLVKREETKTKYNMKINDLVWLKQHDYKGECWTLGRIIGFTNKMIKCEDLTRPDAKQQTNHVGNFKPINVRLLTSEEIKEGGY